MLDVVSAAKLARADDVAAAHVVRLERERVTRDEARRIGEVEADTARSRSFGHGERDGIAHRDRARPQRDTDALPPNVSARSVAATIAAPVSRTAMCAAPITSGRSPYSFEIRMRT